MLLYNALIFRGERGFVPGSVAVSGERIAEVTEGVPSKASEPSEEGIDLRGACMLPGLIDLHTHGNSGYDFSDGQDSGLREMGRYLASRGITSFLPTSMTLPFEALDRAFQTALKYKKDRPWDAARLAGIHMEGPFLSSKRKGAQNGEYLRMPDISEVKRLSANCGGLLRIVDAAPELPGAEEFVRALSGDFVISAAHTDACYEEAVRFFRAGASHVTHLFNAMSGIHHRAPGVIGAAAETDNVTAELICDGLHVHPSIVRMAFKLFPGRICLVSDTLRCCGMQDGAYDLGGQTIQFKDHEARLPDGTIAGASDDLFEDLRRAVSFGIPIEEAVMAATAVPARVIGREREIGSIEAGKYADLIVCSKQLDILQVYLGGRRIV